MVARVRKTDQKSFNLHATRRNIFLLSPLLPHCHYCGFTALPIPTQLYIPQPWRSGVHLSSTTEATKYRGTSTRPCTFEFLTVLRLHSSFYSAYTILAVRRCRQFSSTICRQCSTSAPSSTVTTSTYTSTCTTTRTLYV